MYHFKNIIPKMAKVVKTDMDSLTAQLSVMLDTADYAPKVQAEIKKYSSQASIKGFRPGKTPPNMIKKMYGSSFLYDIVNKKIEDTLNDYLKEANLNMLGKPLLSPNQPKLNLSVNNMPDLVYNFEVGIAPTFEVFGLKDVPFNRYVVQVDAQEVETEIESLCKRMGEKVQVTTDFEDKDMLKFKATATVGEHASEFSILYEMMTYSAQLAMAGKSVGETFSCNLYDFEKDASAEHSETYLMQLPKGAKLETSEYVAEILEATRQVPAKMGQALYDKAFGEGAVTTETEAREIISTALARKYQPNVEGLLLRDIQNSLLEENQFPLPDAYLKLLLKTSDKKNTDELIEKDYPNFANNMRWMLIRNQLCDDFEIKVSEKDLRDYYGMRIRGYLGGQANEALEQQLTDRVLNDEKQKEELFEEVLMEHLFFKMKSVAKINEVRVSVAEFETISANARLEAAKAQGKVVEAEPEMAV
jgi:trigger factor